MTASQWQDRMKKMLADYDAFRNLELFEGLVTEDDPISTWGQFQSWFAPFKNTGSFRGHRQASWNLIPTLDRALLKTVAVENSTVREKLSPERNERAVLLDFQRGAHHHCKTTPGSGEVVDWLALMQHYGAPTRLLDWTRSPYVALYFAVQGDSEGEAALWAIDVEWFEQRSKELLREHDKHCPDSSDFRAFCEYINGILFREDNPYIIVSASPLQLNERMLAQQGQLMCNLRHDVGFSTSLLGMLIHPSIVDRQVVSKVVLKRDQRILFLEELRRMNIHDASLFPGLDGFARSLGVNLDISVAHQIEVQKQEMRANILESRTRARPSGDTP
jgi:hypothetical protein